jgi:hypothetical protein
VRATKNFVDNREFGYYNKPQGATQQFSFSGLTGGSLKSLSGGRSKDEENYFMRSFNLRNGGSVCGWQ